MMQKLNVTCIDINSRYCPCILAETNHCVFCSQLKGEGICDCNWSGLCILYEKQWQGKNEAENNMNRTELITKFDILEQFSNNIFLLDFSVPTELANLLKPIGSFVFLRCPDDPQFFHFPVGIMKVNKEHLQVVIEVVGAKSQKIFLQDNRTILVRGPYHSGILGKAWIDNLNHGKILLIAGGMGQPPALPLAQKLVENNNQVTALLAPGKLGKNCIENELRNLDIAIRCVNSMRKEGLPLVTELLNMSPDLLVSAGPDAQHTAIITAMQDKGVNIPMAVTNNAVMCCGEGICGSCEKEVSNNRKIRVCKMQTDFSSLVHY